MPRPMKERNASPRITPGSSRKTKTISTPSVFGSRWRPRIRYQRAPDGAGRAHVVVLLQRDDLAADDAGGREPGDDRQRDDHRPEVDDAEDRQHDDRERQVRQAVERVEEAHHPVVELAADEAGDRAVEDRRCPGSRTCRRSRSRSRRGRRARRASTGRGRTGRCRAGATRSGQVRLREVDLVRVVRRDARHDDDVGEHREEDDRRDDGAAGWRRKRW